MFEAPLCLSRQTFAVTWRYADVGDMPAALFVPMPGGDLDGQARAEVRAILEIRRLAGWDVRRFGVELEAAYRSLAGAPLEYYGWVVRADGTCFSALVACRPNETLLAIVDEEDVELSRHEPGSGAALLVSTLPSWPPANFRPVSARATEVFGAWERQGSVLRAVIEPVPTDVAMLREICASTATSKGQLYVAVRTPAGRHDQCAMPLNYVDPDAGRIAFYTTEENGGQYLNALPGSAEALGTHLERIREALTRLRSRPPG